MSGVEHDCLMSGKTVQHSLAVAATAVAAIASAFQGQRSLEKADREAASRNASRGFFRGLWDALGSKRKNTGDPDFNENHFRRVAALWGVIMVGALLALFAEALDFWGDWHNWN
jgi:hypothetical protein